MTTPSDRRLPRFPFPCPAPPRLGAAAGAARPECETAGRRQGRRNLELTESKQTWTVQPETLSPYQVIIIWKCSRWTTTTHRQRELLSVGRLEADGTCVCIHRPSPVRLSKPIPVSFLSVHAHVMGLREASTAARHLSACFCVWVRAWKIRFLFTAVARHLGEFPDRAAEIRM